MKLKELFIYVATIITNLSIGFLLTLIFFKGNRENFIFVACGTILLSLLIVSIISQKLNYKLDIFAYQIEDMKYLILNSIFIGDLFSIPLAMFITWII